MDPQKAREDVIERRAMADALERRPATTERGIRLLREAVALLLRESADRLDARIESEHSASGRNVPLDHL